MVKSPIEEKKVFWKIIAGIEFFVIILLVSFFVLNKTKVNKNIIIETQDEPPYPVVKQWKEFRDPNIKFTLNYPEGWIIDMYESNGVSIQNYAGNCETCTKEEKELFSFITIYEDDVIEESEKTTEIETYLSREWVKWVSDQQKRKNNCNSNPQGQDCLPIAGEKSFNYMEITDLFGSADSAAEIHDPAWYGPSDANLETYHYAVLKNNHVYHVGITVQKDFWTQETNHPIMKVLNSLRFNP